MSEKRGLGGAHHGRALRDQALHFKTPDKVIWEYIANSLEYINVSIAEVKVSIDHKKKEISIKDNGRGMSKEELDKNFFMLHGENRDRKEGKITRGQYGTGKAACFGIANNLTISTICKGKLNKVSLKLSDALETEDYFPTIHLRNDEPTNDADGTTIELTEIFYPHKLNEKKIIDRIERELSTESKFSNHKVWVNYFECRPKVIAFREENEHLPPRDDIKKRFGNVPLKVKIAYEDIDREHRGIKVTVNGFTRAISSGGLENKECIERLFGEVELPDLEKAKTPAVKSDRSQKLDLESDDGLMIFDWIGHALDIERKKLIEKKKELQAKEDSKRYEQIGNKLAHLLNQHMREQADELKKAIVANPGDVDDMVKQGAGKGGLVDLVLGGEIEASESDEKMFGHGEGESPSVNADPPRDKEIDPGLKKQDDAEKKAKEVERKSKKKPKGGFSVEFDENGESAYRSKYDPEKRLIIINLDHPQMDKSRNKDLLPDKDTNFLRIAYEAAIQEFSAAIAQEKADANLMEDEVSDAISEIIQITDSLSRKITELYDFK